MKDNKYNKVEKVVGMLKDLGVKVSVTKSKFEIMNTIAHKEKLKLRENNI